MVLAYLPFFTGPLYTLPVNWVIVASSSLLSAILFLITGCPSNHVARDVLFKRCMFT